jgi:hypothetical protein
MGGGGGGEQILAGGLVAHGKSLGLVAEQKHVERAPYATSFGLLFVVQNRELQLDFHVYKKIFWQGEI